MHFSSVKTRHNFDLVTVLTDGKLHVTTHTETSQACDTSACGDADVPTCPKCGSPLRTETVMFEQSLPNGAVEQARSTIQNSDLLVVIGSTLCHS